MLIMANTIKIAVLLSIICYVSSSDQLLSLYSGIDLLREVSGSITRTSFPVTAVNHGSYMSVVIQVCDLLNQYKKMSAYIQMHNTTNDTVMQSFKEVFDYVMKDTCNWMNTINSSCNNTAEMEVMCIGTQLMDISLTKKLVDQLAETEQGSEIYKNNLKTQWIQNTFSGNNSLQTDQALSVIQLTEHNYANCERHNNAVVC